MIYSRPNERTEVFKPRLSFYWALMIIGDAANSGEKFDQINNFNGYIRVHAIGILWMANLSFE
jgi:hypothetical protein